jgi:pyruvate formate lyase activating enzyme
MNGKEKFRDILSAKMTRKKFLERSVSFGAGLAASSFLFRSLSVPALYASTGEKRGRGKALFYKKLASGVVQCRLCPNRCVLENGRRGFCRVREASDGELQTLVYGLVCAQHLDPIEKKPLFHVLPGTRSFSIATAGCNSRCKFCQNWSIAQRGPEQTLNELLLPREAVGKALRTGCDSIAYTYTEPVVFIEYAMDTGRLASEKGLLNVWVTGGKIDPSPLKEACAYIDAANVDLKGFNDRYLREVCAQDLDTILTAIRTMKERGVWIELTNLIVPTLNDNMEDIRRMAAWIASEVGTDVPLHFSRFWPQYKLRSLYPTPVDTLERAREAAFEEGLRYVYLGNVPGRGYEDTRCPGCGSVVISRRGFRVVSNSLVSGECPSCGKSVPGIWK